MNDLPKVFVSYTTRDGLVTLHLLRLLEGNLKEICNPFVHATANNNNDIGQVKVIKKLASSHMLLLIESPFVKKSPWVMLELLIAKLLLIPVIRLSVDTISNTISKANNNLHPITSVASAPYVSGEV